jgi:hypothetical protein
MKEVQSGAGPRALPNALSVIQRQWVMIQPGAVNEPRHFQGGLKTAGLPLVALAYWPCRRQSSRPDPKACM